MGTNINQGSLGIAQHLEPAGPPFPATSADNGLSVDAITGRIVLGGPQGSGSPLLDSREIILDGNEFWLSWFAGELALQLLNYDISLGDISSGSNGVVLNISNSGNAMQFQGNTGGVMLVLDFAMSRAAIGDVGQVNSGLNLSIDGITGIARFANNIDQVAFFDLINKQSQIGDLNALANGLVETIDDLTGIHDVSNSANTAVYSINGNMGASGTFVADGGEVVTVEGGIITSIV